MLFSLLPNAKLGLHTILIASSLLMPTAHVNASNTLEKVATEYQIKAAYLYNFARYIKWPANAFESDDAPFVFCVLGKELFIDELQTLGTQHTINNRSLEVNYPTELTDVESCHILFVAESAQNKIMEWLDYLYIHHKPILTVSDIPEFVESGGMIMFYINPSDQVRIALDLETLAEVNLSVSHDLFDVSNKVYYGRQFD